MFESTAQGRAERVGHLKKKAFRGFFYLISHGSPERMVFESTAQKRGECLRQGQAYGIMVKWQNQNKSIILSTADKTFHLRNLRITSNLCFTQRLLKKLNWLKLKSNHP
jgi:hypothetical protein